MFSDKFNHKIRANWNIIVSVDFVCNAEILLFV